MYYAPDKGSLLPKYRDCTTSNDFELYLMCCGVMLLLLIIYMYIYFIIRDNVANEGFRVLDYLQTKHEYKT